MISIDIEKKMRTYQGHTLLRVKAQLALQSITKVTGVSGSGKTTFVKILAGLVHPEKGKIMFGDTLWLDTSTRFSLPPQKRKTALVFQDYALFPNMTVLQHLEYATTDRRWINQLLSFGKLETLSGHKPIYLSGGQQQRLAIVRALAIKPTLLLMDEPFSALDQEMRATLITDLKGLITELGSTCLIATHNPQELAGIANGELKIG